MGVVVVAYNAVQHLPYNLPPLLGSGLRPRVLVVDASSPDRTAERAERMGAEVMVIPRRAFDHGATRELARQRLGTDVAVMMTQDAYPVDEHALEKLVRPILEGRAAVSYGRQAPHEGAGFLETFSRRFNYPGRSHVRGMEDVKTYGAYTFFCSDAFAAYDNHALDAAGGFRPILSNEDAVAAAMLLHAGHHIAYVAEAVVRHSHRYTLRQEMARQWDAGFARMPYRELLTSAGRHERLGGRFAGALFMALLRRRPWLIPYALAQTIAKGLGYKVGQRSHRAPLWFKRLMSGQDYYWTDSKSEVQNPK